MEETFMGRRLHRLATISALVVLAVALVTSTARAQTVAKVSSAGSGPSVGRGPTVGKGPYYPLPSWDQTLPSNARFLVLSNFGNAAVLDVETGLVWERSPDPTPANWNPAQTACRNKVVGNRFGWRLPSIQELMSLMDGDPANTDEPRLPPGHPFIGVAGFYWSGTTEADFADRVYILRFSFQVFAGSVVKTVNNIPSWCVRGGSGTDAQ
jgi:hypothetical protein